MSAGGSFCSAPGTAGWPAAAAGSAEANFLLSSIRLANRIIFDSAKDRREYTGMGTTVVAVLAQDDRFVLAHVGDSRIYRIRRDHIVQISRDHSFVQEQVDSGMMSAAEAHQSQYRHMITRALGLKESVDVDLTEEPARPGDVLLLCSDGLSDLLDDEDMLVAVRDHAGDLDQACQALVDRANAKGGDDNITVLVVQAQAGNEVESGHRGRTEPAAAAEGRGMFARLKRAWKDSIGGS